MAVSTINKTGQNYDTLTLWEDDKDGNLVGDTRQETAECYDDDGSLSDSNITIEGSTTDATYYMKITVPDGDRHNGTIASGFAIDPPNATVVIEINDPYTVVEWIVIKNWGRTSTWSIGSAIATGGFATDVDEITIRYCIVANNNGAGNSDQWGIITGDTAYADIYIYNNIVYSITSTNAARQSVAFYETITNAKTQFWNNTAYNIVGGEFGNGMRNGNVAYNNVCYNCSVDFAGTQDTASNNFSKDDTAPGANSIHGTTDGKTPDFVSTVDDFHLQSTSDAIDAGIDLSALGFLDDIDGEERTGTWDIGADEYVGEEPEEGYAQPAPWIQTGGYWGF